MTLADAPLNAAVSPAEKKTPEALIFMAVLLVAALWGLSVFMFGVPGLYLPALALVPVMMVIIVMITQG